MSQPNRHGRRPSGEGEAPRESIREFGHDGITGMVSWDRGVRAREVSRPDQADHDLAAQVLDSLLDRAQGRRGR